MSDPGNGKLDAALRFLGLADGQRRGHHEARPVVPPPPSPDELRNLALASLLRQDFDGSTVLLQFIQERRDAALASAHEYVGTHAICTGFLGAEAVLSRLYEDLNKLRG